MTEKIIQQQQKLQKTHYIPRDRIFEKDILKLHKIISIVWPRRSGKTTYMIQIINELIQADILSRSQVVYIDFNDHIGGDFDFEQLLQHYKTILHDQHPIFFFDEIQEVDNMRSGIFFLYNLWYQVFITGSNSKILSSELSTHFRGKWYEIPLWNLSFKEYCIFLWLSMQSLSYDDQWTLLYHFRQYIARWWYPEIVLAHDNETLKTNIIKTYMDIMIYKDLMERYKINNELILKYTIQKIIKSNTKQININKLYNECKSLWIKWDKNMFYHIVDHLQSVFFISLLTQQYKPQWFKKSYLIDTVYQTIYDSTSDNFGQKFESTIYQHLLKWNQKIYYQKNTEWEIDFMLDSGCKIQVCRERNDENNQRETGQLSAWDFFIYAIDKRSKKTKWVFKSYRYDEYLLQ